jgi:hypothetical protein
MPAEIRSETISFRITPTELKQFERIASILNQEGKIRSDSVGSLVRALCFVKINEFIQIELLQKMADENEKKLQEMKNRHNVSEQCDVNITNDSRQVKR